LNFDEKITGLGSWSRRRFVQISAASALSASLGNLTHAETGGSATMIDVPFEKRNPKIAMIGTGGRGTNLLENLLAADAQVVALCDVVKEKAEHAGSLVVELACGDGRLRHEARQGCCCGGACRHDDRRLLEDR